MEKRRLGDSDLQVSEVGLGCNSFGPRADVEMASSIIDAARDCEITFLDTADAYGRTFGESETILGEVLRGRREAFVIATKFGVDRGGIQKAKHGSAAYIEVAVNDSLQRLQTDHIDLYQLHYPPSSTPIEETLEALTRLVRSGKVRYIGCSNHNAAQLRNASYAARRLGTARFVCAQEEYNILNRTVEEELSPVLLEEAIGLVPYFPLAGGLLSGKYRRGTKAPDGSRFDKTPALADRFLTDANFHALEQFTCFAQERGHDILDLAFAWLLSRAHVASVIAGASNPAQVIRNVQGARWKLTPDDLQRLSTLTSGTVPTDTASHRGVAAR